MPSFLSLSLFHSLSFSLLFRLFRSSTLNTRSFEYSRFHSAPIHTIIRGTKFLFVRALFRLVQFFVTDYTVLWPVCRVVVSRSSLYKWYTTRSLISTRSVDARAHFFLTNVSIRGFTHAPHSSTLSRPTAREMYTFARRFPIVPSFDSFPFNFQVEACQFFSRYTFPFSNDPRKNIALVSGREFQIFVAKLRFFLLCPSRTGRISNRARFFFFNDEKLEPPFVNGNIEKSYKFGAVYPQNFTFFQYRFVLGMTHAIRKIRIYGKNHTGNWASERGRHRRNE